MIMKIINMEDIVGLKKLFDNKFFLYDLKLLSFTGLLNISLKKNIKRVDIKTKKPAFCNPSWHILEV